MFNKDMCSLPDAVSQDRFTWSLALEKWYRQATTKGFLLFVEDAVAS